MIDIDMIAAADRRIRRFRRRHPILYRRWIKTLEGRQYKLTKDIQEGKVPGIMS